MLTCAQIGKYVGVAPRTVAKWIQTGKLSAACGSSMMTYRVDVHQFNVFCRDNGYKEYVEADVRVEELRAEIRDLEEKVSDEAHARNEAEGQAQEAEARLAAVRDLASRLDRRDGFGAILYAILHDGATDVELLLAIHGKDF